MTADSFGNFPKDIATDSVGIPQINPFHSYEFFEFMRKKKYWNSDRLLAESARSPYGVRGLRKDVWGTVMSSRHEHTVWPFLTDVLCCECFEGIWELLNGIF